MRGLTFLATLIRLIIDNFMMYIVVIIASILLPVLAPSLFHSPSQLQGLSKIEYQRLIRHDILMILSLSLIVSTLLVGFFNSIIKPSRHILLGCLMAFIIWSIVYITLTIKRRK